jgi:hypothetical protein
LLHVKAEKKGQNNLTINYYRHWLARDNHDLSSERAPNRDEKEKFEIELISGRKSQSGLDTKTY